MNTVIVTGDFLIDHHIYEGKRRHFGDFGRDGVCVTEELGGGALIHRMLSEMQGQHLGNWQSHLAINENMALRPTPPCSPSAGSCVDQPFSSYAFWRGYPASSRTKELRWRVAEAMGFGGGPAAAGEWPWETASCLPTDPTVLVISDGGMGFRSRINIPHWRVRIHDQRLITLFSENSRQQEGVAFPEFVAQDPQWILLKLSAPVGEGDLWRELQQFHSDRLVVVVSAAELRRAEVRLSEGLSWEQTLEDLQQALISNPRLQALTRCEHLIISFDTEAALWLKNDGNGQYTATFLFDPACVENERGLQMAGSVYGYLSCLTATVAAELAADPKTPDLERGLRSGLAAMRFLREYGHGDAQRRGAGFPAAVLAKAAVSGDAARTLQIRRFSCDRSTSPVRPGWSLLALHESPAAAAAGVPLNGIARRVLIQGPHVLLAPTLRVGDFFTADRSEIEAVRSLRLLVNRYIEDRRADKPLSIGVFGPPGAGKSFAVRELAKSLLGDRLGWLEFNLSQFNGPADLIGALHQVRDRILEGRMPVAFFDEFDSQNFVWLKYLLAPMQDGRFQEGQVSHPVGQCLFVFAGGTSHSFESFEQRGASAGKPGQPDADHFVLSKGPDFASRLDGRLNVIGPNPRVGHNDIFCPVRRALFIRSRLRCGDADRLSIHPGLATALLELPRFRHGARSLTKLLEPFRLQRRTQPDAPLSPSGLLPADQLALHVDVAAFDALLRRDEDAANRLGVDTLAAAVHAFYRKKGKDEKWIQAHHDVDFEHLPPFDQASNRAAARRIPGILALVGLRLTEGLASPAELSEATSVLTFHEELLGEAEHDGWMDWHFDNGWSQSETRQDACQQHNRLVRYADLPDTEKKKDKAAIHYYPKIAALAGMKIVPVSTP